MVSIQKYKDNNDSLLITLGCSWTKGVGAYDPEITNKYNFNKSTDDVEKFIVSHKYEIEEYEVKYGWAAKLANYAEFDLANIAYGGNSNEAAMIDFTHFLATTDLSAYTKIKVIFMLSNSNRFAITGPCGKSRSFMGYDMPWLSADVHGRYHKEFLVSVFDEEGQIKISVRTLFLIQSICKANDFEFYFGSALDDINIYKNNLFSPLINWDNSIHNTYPYPSLLSHLYMLDGISDISEVDSTSRYLTSCFHPTMYGHEIIFNVLRYIIGK